MARWGDANAPVWLQTRDDADMECPVCSMSYTTQDAIPLNAPEEEVRAYRLPMSLGAAVQLAGVKSRSGAWQVERLRAELEMVSGRKKKRKEAAASSSAKKRHLVLH